MSKLTIMQARLRAAELACTLRKTQHGEFRVCLIGYPEQYACYETDLQSALDTAAAQYTWLMKNGKLSRAKAAEPLGYAIVKRQECGKCWEVDTFVRKIFWTFAEAEEFLQAHAMSIKTGQEVKIVAVSDLRPVSLDSFTGMEDLEQEARREQTKGE